jgi:hypothetical protein
MELSFDAVSQTYDTGYRDFYFYNASGHLVKDSMELWHAPTAGSWMPLGTYNHTVNSAGYPTKTEFVFFGGAVNRVIFESNYTYNSLNQRTATLERRYDGSGLSNYFRDTVGYAGAQKQYGDEYLWDTASNTWALAAEERRHMNAAGLPDSAFGRYNYNAGSWDTAICKLAYDAQDNPVSCRIFAGASSSGPDIEYRWYYEPVSLVGVSHVVPAETGLTAYPNPAGETLYLKGATEGSYTIHNMAGQIIQLGTLRAACLPVNALPPGVYSLRLQDNSGTIFTARFTKQ